MTTKGLGIAVVGSGRIGTLAPARGEGPERCVSSRCPTRTRPTQEAGGFIRRAFPLRRQRRSYRAPEHERRVRLDAGRRACRGGMQSARFGRAVLVENRWRCRSTMPGRRQYAQAHQRHLARRLSPPLQGMLSARQGAVVHRRLGRVGERPRRGSTIHARKRLPSSSANHMPRRCSTC